MKINVGAEEGKVLVHASESMVSLSVDEAGGLIRALQDAIRAAQRQSRDEAFTHKRR